LVAFSGSVEDGDITYTETGMNTAAAGQRIPESATADTFKQSAYSLLIVAEKFQTGFDQPLLYAMYVDKKLGGVNAVQTLSRLNRIHPGKDDPIVLDFVNEADAIQAAFQPYYEATLLSEQTDPNVLYALQGELDEMQLYTAEEIDAFAAVYFKGDWKNPAPLYALLDPIVTRVAELPREDRLTFRSGLNDFVRLYAFLSQILPFTETDWEKRFHFYRLLLNRILQRLPDMGEGLPDAIRNQVDVSFYRTQKTHSGTITLESRVGELKPVGTGTYNNSPAASEHDPLSVIIEELNTAYGVQTNGDAEAAIAHLQAKLTADIALEKGAEVNPPATFRTLFDDRADDHFGEMVDAFYKFYNDITANPQAKQRFFDWLFEQYQQRK
jgi:type I restriction enzyme R subunit